MAKKKAATKQPADPLAEVKKATKKVTTKSATKQQVDPPVTVKKAAKKVTRKKAAVKQEPTAVEPETKRGGLRRPDKVNIVPSTTKSTKTETTSEVDGKTVSKKLFRVKPKPKSSKPTNREDFVGKEFKPAQVKRLKDESGYMLALQSLMSRTKDDNMLLSSSGIQSFANIVMPIPLILQLQTCTNGIPYSSFIEIAGDKGSNKSSFLLGLANIINGQCYMAEDYAGWCDYVSAETKFPDGLASAICGYRDEMMLTRPDKMLAVNPFESSTMNDWQSLIQQRVKAYTKAIDPKRHIPFLIGIDSLTAKLLQETYDSIEKEGYASRAYAIEAFSLKQFVSKITGDITGYPMIVAAINHVARDKDPGKFGAEVRRKPGGRFQDYQQTFDFDLKPQMKPQKRHVELTETQTYPYIHTNVLRFKVEKSSLGETFRTCRLFLEWTHTRAEHFNPLTNKVELSSPRQRMWWKWGQSLAYHLSDKCLEFDSRMKQLLKSVVDIRYENETSYRCPTFGRAAFDPETLGRMIECDPVMSFKIKELFGVMEYPVFEPLTNYTEMAQTLRGIKATKEFSN